MYKGADRRRQDISRGIFCQDGVRHKKLAFNDKINQNAVVRKANYKLPQTIQPISAVTYIEKSLYAGEHDDMNQEELSL